MSRITEYTRDGLTFDVIDSGPEDGAPVLLLHGFPERAKGWNQVADRLHAEGFRTYAPDQRGYSPRARVASRFGYRIDALVDDALALIDEIGGPVHVVGHDWGAIVAWGLAMNHPDSVRTLTAVSVPHPAAFIKAVTTSTQLFKSYYMLMFQIPWLPERLLANPKIARRFMRGAGMTSDEVRAFQRDFVEYGATRGALGWYRSLPLSIRDESSRVRVPTTYVWSTEDIALGRKGAESCGDYVTGPYRLEIIDGATHWLPTQQPDRLAEIIVDRVRSAAAAA